MAIYTERNGISILDTASDPEGEPVSVVKINGEAALIGAPLALSTGGSVIVASDGHVVFDDTGFTWPGLGASVYDSLIATISDGTHEVPVSVNLAINHI